MVKTLYFPDDKALNYVIEFIILIERWYVIICYSSLKEICDHMIMTWLRRDYDETMS